MNEQVQVQVLLVWLRCMWFGIVQVANINLQYMNTCIQM